MKLSNKAYDIIKYCLFTVVPATIGLISTLGIIYKFDTEVITLTIGAIATFIGALTGLSNYNYNKVKVEKVKGGK